MAYDNRATSNQEDARRQGLMNNILSSMGLSDFSEGFGQAFNLDSEDRRDALYSRREAEGKAAIPPRYQQTLSQHPLIDSIRQFSSTTDNQTAASVLRSVGLGPFNDGMYSFRANNGLNVGGSPASGAELPDLEFDEKADRIRIPNQQEQARIAADKKRVRDLPVMTKVGYALGGMANDFTTNATRNLWWLINAPQAIVDIASEAAVAHANPNLYREEVVDLDTALKQKLVRYSPDYDEAAISRAAQDRQMISEPLPQLTGEAAEFGGYTKKGEDANRRAIEDLVRQEMYSADNPKNYKRAAPGVRVRFDPGSKRWEVRRRAYSPTLVNAASMLPAAIAVNTGIGLIGSEDNGSITGRQAGYQAAVPDELDPRVTSNAVAEVAMRYLLGREGRLMDMDDFLLERPDATAGEYSEYKGYLRDRETDLNPFDDGKINIAGILKTNPDGIRGAEVNFLGKSMGVNDTLIPTASAIAGSALGAFAGRHPRIRNNKVATIASLVGGGAAGLLGGQATGSALEDQRRRSNFAERNPGVDYDKYRANARELMDQKYNLIKANPNAQEEKAESKVGFNKRNQQQALQTKALQQQVLVDQILDQEQKARAQKAMGTQQWALDKSASIDAEIRKRRESQEEEQPASLSLNY